MANVTQELKSPRDYTFLQITMNKILAIPQFEPKGAYTCFANLELFISSCARLIVAPALLSFLSVLCTIIKAQNCRFSGSVRLPQTFV